MASMVEGCLENGDSLIELNWDSAEVIKSVMSFSRITLLHRYIFAMLTVEHRYEFRRNADIYEESPNLIEEIERLIEAYEVPFVKYADFQAPVPIEEAKTRAEYPFHDWFRSQEGQFELLWEKMTDEVFHLLFANRSFLLRFNITLAEYIRKNVKIPEDIINSKGSMQRAAIPKWVRDAVFYRDHGRCVLCYADLSGLLSLDQLDHFDHMVPLANGGVNDPCNIQLMCEACNLKKGHGQPITGRRYPTWWPD
jgi:hypothetical protein